MQAFFGYFYKNFLGMMNNIHRTVPTTISILFFETKSGSIIRDYGNSLILMLLLLKIIPVLRESK